jgi:hypothetical protein
MPTKLAHLYALLVGVCVHIAGWFLMSYETGDHCWWEYAEYDYRRYGVAVILVSLIFVVLVIRDARKQVHD